MRASRTTIVGIAVSLAAAAAFAQEAGFTRTPLQDGNNIGSGAAKVLATCIVEKGKPVATPVK